MSEIKATASVEQVLYAKVLEKGMYFGLGLMFLTFALYIFGIMKPAVPVDEIASYWNQPVHDYLVAINTNFLHLENLPTGWAWLSLVNKGDFINFIPIAILSGVTMVCFMVIVPGLFQRGDKIYGVIAIIEVAILALAASGLLAVGGH